MTPGKLWSMRRLADAQGRFKMLAVDQRPPIQQIIARGRGVAPQDASFADMCAIKRLLALHLAPEVSAVLLDPNFAYPAAIDVVPAHAGLIMTLEDHRFEETPHGRRSYSIADWSVAKIKRLGADGVKVLAWYRPDADPAICRHQEAFVEEVGRACAAEDIPFILELLLYPIAGDTGYQQDSARHAALDIESVRHFADPKFAVDLFKLESPVPIAQLPDTRDSNGMAAAQACFDALGRAAGRPWVMLSAGAGPDAFAHMLGFAYRAGASGFLAGRAIWWRALEAFPDLATCRQRVEDEAIPYLRNLCLDADVRARPVVFNPAGLSAVATEGEFARSVPDR